MFLIRVSVNINFLCGNSPAKTISLTVLALPTVTASAAPDSVCSGNSTSLTAGGANTYLWDDGNSNTSQTVSPTVNTTYTVTGTDVNNCVNTGTISVIINQLPTLTYNQNPNAVCSNHAPFTLSIGFPTGGTYSGLGVSGNTFNPATAGTGTITITYSYTDAHGCTNTISKNIVDSTCSTTEINKLASGNEVSIYPNPASSSLQVSFSGNIQNTTIEVYNTIGECVHRQIITSPSPPSKGETLSIDVSDLAEGIYNIGISSNMGVVNKRVVIVR